MPRAGVLQSTPTATQVTPLPTELWRIVLPTATPRPTDVLVVLPRQPVTPSPEPTINIWSSAACGCASDVYSCSDFVSQEAAQLCMNWCVEQTGEDVHHLVYTDTSDIYAWDGWACITIEDWIKKGQP